MEMKGILHVVATGIIMTPRVVDPSKKCLGGRFGPRFPVVQGFQGHGRAVCRGIPPKTGRWEGGFRVRQNTPPVGIKGGSERETWRLREERGRVVAGHFPDRFRSVPARLHALQALRHGERVGDAPVTGGVHPQTFGAVRFEDVDRPVEDGDPRSSFLAGFRPMT